MKIYKISVDDRDYEHTDGFDLYSNNPEEIANIIKTTIKNGFDTIEVKTATKKELAEQNLIYKTEFELGE